MKSNNWVSSAISRSRIEWAVVRYDFWLDFRCVRFRERRSLRRELRVNLLDASATVGTGKALAGVGSPRTLAAAATIDGSLTSRWVAGTVAAFTAFFASNLLFLIMSLYYTEGVLDSGTTGQASSSLFPFIGSRVAVDSSAAGFSIDGHPGFLPLGAAILTWLAVARPWRARGPGSNHLLLGDGRNLSNG